MQKLNKFFNLAKLQYKEPKKRVESLIYAIASNIGVITNSSTNG